MTTVTPRSTVLRIFFDQSVEFRPTDYALGVGTYRVGRRTRQEILVAAEGLLAARGYHAVSVTDIAEAAQCAKASVMYHFKTKIDILAAIMEPVVDDYDALRDRIVDLPPDEARSVAAEGYVDLVIRHRRPAAIVRLEMAKLLSEDAMAPLLRAGAFLPMALTAGRTDGAAQARAMFAITGVLGAALQDFSSLPEAELREALVDCLSDLLGK
jgi:AcrR family transcriptional regulator